MKPSLKTITDYYDYHEVIDYIEKKYKIDTRDYAGSEKYRKEWYKNHKVNGNTQKGYQLYLKSEEKKHEPPYLDFWHWIVDQYEIDNGSFFYLDVEPKDKYPDWVCEILSLIKDEFASDDSHELKFLAEW